VRVGYVKLGISRRTGCCIACRKRRRTRLCYRSPKMMSARSVTGSALVKLVRRKSPRKETTEFSPPSPPGRRLRCANSENFGQGSARGIIGTLPRSLVAATPQICCQNRLTGVVLSHLKNGIYNYDEINVRYFTTDEPIRNVKP